MSEAPLNAVIEERTDLNERYSILRIRPDRRPVPPFTPGQFVQLGLPQLVAPKPGEASSGDAPPRTRIAKRAYSIASSANERDHYELFLTLVPRGRLTSELWKLEAGARCWIGDGALGTFTLDGVPPVADLLMVATGTGISPYVSMLRTHAERPRWNRFVLIHGVRSAADLGFRSELQARQKTDACFRYVPVVSREPERWTGIQGRVQVALDDERFCGLGCGPLDPKRFHVFLCGNPDMIQSVREMLAPKGFQTAGASAPGNLHVEKYW